MYVFMGLYNLQQNSVLSKPPSVFIFIFLVQNLTSCASSRTAKGCSIIIAEEKFMKFSSNSMKFFFYSKIKKIYICNARDKSGWMVEVVLFHDWYVICTYKYNRIHDFRNLSNAQNKFLNVMWNLRNKI